MNRDELIAELTSINARLGAVYQNLTDICNELEYKDSSTLSSCVDLTELLSSKISNFVNEKSK